MVSASIQEIVHAFLQTYYQRMKTNPSKLSNLYSNTAELTHINYNLISPSTDSTHSSIIPSIKLTGKDNINKFFSRHENEVTKLKVKLDTCDFQTMGVSHRNVLIVVTGELFWDDTPANQFCQTFILIPIGKNSDIYDISNDIIRFIPDSFKTVQFANGGESLISKKEEAGIRHSKAEIKEEHKSPQSVSVVGIDDTVVNGKKDVDKQLHAKSEKASKKFEHHHHHTKSVESGKEVKSEVEPVKNGSKVESPEDQIVKEANVKVPIEKENSKVMENKVETSVEAVDIVESVTPVEESKPEVATTVDEPEIENSDATIATAGEESTIDLTTTTPNTTTEESTTTSSPVHVTTTPPAKLSWASKLASTDATKEAKKILVAKPTAPTTVVTPEPQHNNQHKNSKKNTGDKKVDMTSRKENASNRRKKLQNGGNVANKDGFYSVFISGSYGLSDEILKNTLSKEFGPVMKVNSNENYTVIDFQTHASQIAMLEMKKMKIQGCEITIERKANKKSNLQTNSSQGKTTTNDGFISSSKSHRKYQNNNANKKRETSSV